MGYTFRTDGPWGTGINEDLTPEQVDENFWQAIQDIAAKAVQGVGIANFVVSGNQFTVVLTDHTLLGPYTLPLTQLVFRGDWQPNTIYLAGDIITNSGSTYMVLFNHTSAATFDPGANDGLGDDYYGLLLSNPSLSLPTGGATGTFLRKTSSTDYAIAWQTAALGDLSNVIVPTPASGDVLTWNGHWVNLPAVHFLNDLTDVTITTPSNGQILVYNAGIWSNVAPSVQTTGTALTGEPLAYDGTKFTNVNHVDLPFFSQNVTGGGTITIARSNGEVQSLDVNSNMTLAFSGWPSSSQFARLVLRLINHGTYTVTWPASLKWAGGIVPTVSTNATDLYIFFSYDGGTTVYANALGQNYL